MQNFLSLLGARDKTCNRKHPTPMSFITSGKVTRILRIPFTVKFWCNTLYCGIYLPLPSNISGFLLWFGPYPVAHCGLYYHIYSLHKSRYSISALGLFISQSYISDIDNPYIYTSLCLLFPNSTGSSLQSISGTFWSKANLFNVVGLLVKSAELWVSIVNYSELNCT